MDEAITTQNPVVEQRIRLSSTSEAMRFVGAGLLLASASTFMLQHWEHGSTTLRYGCLLAHTLLLAAAGLLCGLHVRESRAARTFFGLVLASVPVHFAVLGGMVRSAFELDRVRGSNPLWPVDGPLQALALLAVGLAIVLPLARFATTALCRPHAARLARAALLLNAFVLVPLRAPNFVAIECGLMLALLLLLDHELAGLGYAIRTAGARLARALLLAPICIVVGRTLLWYEPTQVACGAFAACGALALFFAAPRAFDDEAACELLQAGATALAMFGTLLMFEPLATSRGLAHGVCLPLLVLPPAATAAGLSCFARSGGQGYRRFAALLAAFALGMNVLLCWDLERCTLAATLALLVGLSVLFLGVYAGQRLVFYSGTLTASLAALQLMAIAIHHGALSNWGSLSLIGGALIFAAALVERHADRLLGYRRSLRARLCAW